MKWLVLHYRRRFRQYRKQCRLLTLQLEAERWRNIAREDMFVSAAIMGSRQMFGVAPRLGPAYQPQRAQAPTPPVDPYALSGADLMEFEVEWWPHAQAKGLSMAQAKQKFYQDVVVPRRMPLNDYGN